MEMKFGKIFKYCGIFFAFSKLLPFVIKKEKARKEWGKKQEESIKKAVLNHYLNGIKAPQMYYNINNATKKEHKI